MKKKIRTVIIFATLICMSICGCNEKDVTPISTSVTTVTSATEVLETTAIPSTVVWTETVTEAVVAVTTVTAPQTETPKVEVEPSEFYETT